MLGGLIRRGGMVRGTTSATAWAWAALILPARYLPNEILLIGSAHFSCFHNSDRIKALAQWKKHSRTVTRIATCAGEPRAASRSRMAGSTISSAVPLTRRVSLVGGVMNKIPTRGLARIFCRPKSSLLPLRSGIRRVLRSSIATKPGASPWARHPGYRRHRRSRHQEGRAADEVDRIVVEGGE